MKAFYIRLRFLNIMTVSEKKTTRRNYLKWIGTAIGIGVVGGLGYYFYNEYQRATQIAKKKKIKLGLLFSLTGVAANIGQVQKEGALLALDEIAKEGGLTLSTGEIVEVDYVVADDQTNLDAALRRYRELVEVEKVDCVIGQTFASISAAINGEVKNNPKVAYFPVNVVPLSMFKKDTIAPITFSIMGNAYSIGYAAASYIVKNLGYNNVYFFAPAYAFGWDQWSGAKAALEKLGAKYDYIESPVGTPDFTSYLNKIAEAAPEIVMFAHWGSDAINVLKQAYELGLNKKTAIFFNWLTNVFGVGVPAEALEDVYSLMFFYWNLEKFPDEEVRNAVQDFVKRFTNKYGYPPDPYASSAYMGVKEALRGIQLAGSTNAFEIADAILKKPEFNSVKGPAKWRIDHEAIFKYGAFVARGKGPNERTSQWDLVEIIGAYTGEDYLPPLEELGY